MVKEAQDKLAGRGRPDTADNMVAELPFGFWVSLASQ